MLHTPRLCVSCENLMRGVFNFHLKVFLKPEILRAPLAAKVARER
jgi:hypothetical protein